MKCQHLIVCDHVSAARILCFGICADFEKGEEASHPFQSPAHGRAQRNLANTAYYFRNPYIRKRMPICARDFWRYLYIVMYPVIYMHEPFLDILVNAPCAHACCKNMGGVERMERNR